MQVDLTQVDRQPLVPKVWPVLGLVLLAPTVLWLPARAKHSVRVFMGEEAASVAGREGSDGGSSDGGSMVAYPASLNPARRLMMTQQYARYRHYLVLSRKAGKSGGRPEWGVELRSAVAAYDHVADMADPSAFDSFPYPHHLDYP